MRYLKMMFRFTFKFQYIVKCLKTFRLKQQSMIAHGKERYKMIAHSSDLNVRTR